jgi:hypothetical protein
MPSPNHHGLPAVLTQPEDAIETAEDLLVVGDGDDRGLLLGGELAKEVHVDASPFGVERSGRLVGDDDPWPVGERSGASIVNERLDPGASDNKT